MSNIGVINTILQPLSRVEVEEGSYIGYVPVKQLLEISEKVINNTYQKARENLQGAETYLSGVKKELTLRQQFPKETTRSLSGIVSQLEWVAKNAHLDLGKAIRKDLKHKMARNIHLAFRGRGETAADKPATDKLSALANITFYQTVSNAAFLACKFFLVLSLLANPSLGLGFSFIFAIGLDHLIVTRIFDYLYSKKSASSEELRASINHDLTKDFFESFRGFEESFAPKRPYHFQQDLLPYSQQPASNRGFSSNYTNNDLARLRDNKEPIPVVQRQSPNNVTLPQDHWYRGWGPEY